MAFQIEKNALIKVSDLQDSDYILFISSAGGNNAGNKLITWADFKAEIEQESSNFTSVISTTDTTESTTKDTGSIITEGGIGIEKSLGLGLHLYLEKEVDHIIYVNDSTTTDENGGEITITAGKSDGIGKGGGIYINGGRGGSDGNGGDITLVTGQGGTTSGNSGSINIGTASELSSDYSGTIEIGSGQTKDGLSGNVTIRTGTVNGTGYPGYILINPGDSASTTNEACTFISRAVHFPNTTITNVSTGDTVTGAQLLKGLITVTGGTGNLNLPSFAQLSTATEGNFDIPGSHFDFVLEAINMTAGNTVTLVVGANMTTKSVVTGGTTLTLTQASDALACFRVTSYGSGCVISRLY